MIFGYPPPVWTINRRIDAPADVVWGILVDLTLWPQWGPSVSGAELDGDTFELGAAGRVRTAVGISLPFVISEFDPGRSWGWRVAGVPATGHGVKPDGAGCRAWMSAPRWAPVYLPVLEIGLRRIERIAVGATP